MDTVRITETSMSLAGKPIKEESYAVTIPPNIEFAHIDTDYAMPADASRLVAVGIYVDSSKKPSDLMTIGLGTKSTSDIVGQTSYKSYLDGGHGTYIERFKPVSIESRGNLHISFRPNDVNIKEEITVLMHFIYLKSDDSCKK